jgi:hypothetical protein
MLTAQSLILKKAEYLVGRPLTNSEAKYFLRKVQSGCMKELKTVAASIKLSANFHTVSEVVEEYNRTKSFDDMGKEDLLALVEDLVIKTTSVQSGLKILAKASTMSREAIYKYIFSLYLNDWQRTEKYHSKKANRPAITTDQSNRPPVVENALSPLGNFSYENPDKDPRTHNVNDYNPDTKQLSNEFVTRPTHSEPKKFKNDKYRKVLFDLNIGRPTGGDPDGDTRK